jgi:diguanylate cyclase (GGDEF)-like protein
MSMITRSAKALLSTDIRNDRDLRSYVVRTTILCIVLAVGIDVFNQLIFFESWPIAVKSWVVTSVIALVIAAPVSRAIARAHLELYRAKLDFEKLSRTDPLTDLPNRRALIEVAERPMADAMSLVIVDIDRFKRVNDLHGHLAGDEVIKAVAGRMKDELGSLGQLGRLGGEEFALLTSGVAPEVLAARLKDFRDHVATTPLLVSGQLLAITVSAGVALRPPADDFTELYSNADRALYIAKKSGRNRVCFIDRSELGDPGPTDRDEAAWLGELVDSPPEVPGDRRKGSRSVA